MIFWLHNGRCCVYLPGHPEHYTVGEGEEVPAKVYDMLAEAAQEESRPDWERQALTRLTEKHEPMEVQGND